MQNLSTMFTKGSDMYTRLVSIPVGSASSIFRLYSLHVSVDFMIELVACNVSLPFITVWTFYKTDSVVIVLGRPIHTVVMMSAERKSPSV